MIEGAESDHMMVGGCAFSSARTDDGTEVLWHDPSMSSVNAERTLFIIPGIYAFPQPIGECQVRFPLLRIRINQDNP